MSKYKLKHNFQNLWRSIDSDLFPLGDPTTHHVSNTEFIILFTRDNKDIGSPKTALVFVEHYGFAWVWFDELTEIK